MIGDTDPEMFRFKSNYEKKLQVVFALIFSFTKIIFTATAAKAAYKKVLTLPMALSKAYRGLRSFLPSSAVVI